MTYSITSLACTTCTLGGIETHLRQFKQHLHRHSAHVAMGNTTRTYKRSSGTRSSLSGSKKNQDQEASSSDSEVYEKISDHELDDEKEPKDNAPDDENAENKDAESEDSNDNDEGEEEYVVEKILDHRVKRGVFWYLLKWEGYDKPEDNTWSSEADCTGCKELIENYWAEHGGRPEKRTRKRTTRKTDSDAAEQPAPKSRRTSQRTASKAASGDEGTATRSTAKQADADIEPSDEEDVPVSKKSRAAAKSAEKTATKRRPGRPRKKAVSEEEEDTEFEAEEEEKEEVESQESDTAEVTTKKTKSTRKSKRRESKTVEAIESGEEDEAPELPTDEQLSLDKLEAMDSWEDLISSIDTIERRNDGSLQIYLTWKNGAISHHDSRITNKKCPQKMLEFYERHLTFRENANDDENEEGKEEGNDEDDMNDLVSD
ncbi:chromodomain protein Swi6 [Schizosaccharomyces japonicus yFS275]|uniref:Chromodomain protein Swi6 n=1 Tax=Schizosaccharomyces japonicus (strain yFS275 / FY16936) TaxID=402676 RepID=B6JYE1_SCHJY|nr:chromodomain protein Swi6 [Schizosaccharomyces japonicus yFS275]EEB06559.2 chromodomain protein Swi6 [Schizosaccharomyces japonicus yFS275]